MSFSSSFIAIIYIGTLALAGNLEADAAHLEKIEGKIHNPYNLDLRQLSISLEYEMEDSAGNKDAAAQRSIPATIDVENSTYTIGELSFDLKDQAATNGGTQLMNVLSSGIGRRHAFSLKVECPAFQHFVLRDETLTAQGFENNSQLSVPNMLETIAKNFSEITLMVSDPHSLSGDEVPQLAETYKAKDQKSTTLRIDYINQYISKENNGTKKATTRADFPFPYIRGLKGIDFPEMLHVMQGNFSAQDISSKTFVFIYQRVSSEEYAKKTGKVLPYYVRSAQELKATYVSYGQQPFRSTQDSDFDLSKQAGD